MWKAVKNLQQKSSLLQFDLHVDHNSQWMSSIFQWLRTPMVLHTDVKFRTILLWLLLLPTNQPPSQCSSKETTTRLSSRPEHPGTESSTSGAGSWAPKRTSLSPEEKMTQGKSSETLKDSECILKGDTFPWRENPPQCSLLPECELPGGKFSSEDTIPILVNIWMSENWTRDIAREGRELLHLKLCNLVHT